MSAEIVIAVIDTNVVVSSLIRADSPPGRLMELVQIGQIEMLVDERILAELDDVLHREELHRFFPPKKADAVFNYILNHAKRVICSRVVDNLPDADDVPFLETALTAGVPLVTGNLKHFPKAKRRGAEVISPSGFLKKYFS